MISPLGAMIKTLAQNWIPSPPAGASWPKRLILRLDHDQLTGAIPARLEKRVTVFDASNNPGVVR